MRIRHSGVPGGRVDLAARTRNDLPIPEVIDQRRVVGVEQPRPTHQGEREHMHVVRLADSFLTESRGMIVHCFVGHRTSSSISQGTPEPLDESSVARQLLSKFAAYDQLSAWARQPIEESLPGRRAVASEYLVCHIGIDDGAHYRPIDRLVSSMKNRP